MKERFNFINSWRAGNKKEKYEISFRLGTFTVLEIKACVGCPEDCTAASFRIILLNFGLEIK